MRGRCVPLLACVLAGCRGPDPETCLLEPGSQAVVSVEDRGSPGGPRPVAALEPDDVAEDLMGRVGRGAYLDPGVRVTVGSDPGYYRETPDEVEKRARLWVSTPLDHPAQAEATREAGPRTFRPPDWRSGRRKVRVVVESGEDRGKAGMISRYLLRPIR